MKVRNMKAWLRGLIIGLVCAAFGVCIWTLFGKNRRCYTFDAVAEGDSAHVRLEVCCWQTCTVTGLRP